MLLSSISDDCVLSIWVEWSIWMKEETVIISREELGIVLYIISNPCLPTSSTTTLGFKGEV